jgi:hypothetical protein
VAADHADGDEDDEEDFGAAYHLWPHTASLLPDPVNADSDPVARTPDFLP